MNKPNGREIKQTFITLSWRYSGDKKRSSGFPGTSDTAHLKCASLTQSNNIPVTSKQHPAVYSHRNVHNENIKIDHHLASDNDVIITKHTKKMCEMFIDYNNNEQIFTHQEIHFNVKCL